MAVGLQGNINDLYKDWLKAQADAPDVTMGQNMSGYLNNQLMGGQQNFGNQMQGAMGAFGQVAALNSLNNQALNNANLNYATGYQGPLDIARLQTEGATALERSRQEGALALERLRQEGSNQRFSQLSPMLSSLFGTGGGNTGGSMGGGAPAGLTGFNAIGADGQKFASAQLGSGAAAGGGGSTGGQVGAPQPGNPSTAQPTNVAAYTAPKKIPMVPPANVPDGYYDGLASGYGQPLSPEDTAAAMARFAATGHYSPMPYANRNAGSRPIV